MGCWAPELCPSGPGTLHACAQVDTRRLTPTRAHTQGHPRRDTHNHVQTRHLFLALPPTLEAASGTGQLWAGWRKAARASLSLRTHPPNPIKPQALIGPSRPTPARLLQEAFLPHAQPLLPNIHHQIASQASRMAWPAGLRQT